MIVQIGHATATVIATDTMAVVMPRKRCAMHSNNEKLPNIYMFVCVCECDFRSFVSIWAEIRENLILPHISTQSNSNNAK